MCEFQLLELWDEEINVKRSSSQFMMYFDRKLQRDSLKNNSYLPVF